VRDPLCRTNWARWPPEAECLRTLFPEESGFYSSEPVVVDEWHDGVMTSVRLWTVVAGTLQELSVEQWMFIGREIGRLLCVQEDLLSRASVELGLQGQERVTVAEWERDMHRVSAGFLVDVRAAVELRGVELSLKLAAMKAERVKESVASSVLRR
jgi:hypothetical protein